MLALEHAFRLRNHSLGDSYHYWIVRGDSEPPEKEYFCQYCAGYFGVPHDDVHRGKVVPDGICRDLGRFPGNPQCCCIDCLVYEEWRNWERED